MHDRSLRLLAMGLLLSALLASAPSARAEDDPTAAGQAGVRWVEGWAAGKAQAKAANKLAFVYFGRHSPT